MRDAAADLDFERAARLRDEIKRLREMELAISDDPLAQYADRDEPGLRPREGQAQQGPRTPHRAAVDDGHCAESPLLRKSRRSTTWDPAPTCRHPAERRLALAVQEAERHSEAHGADYGARTTAASRCSARTRWTK